VIRPPARRFAIQPAATPLCVSHSAVRYSIPQPRHATAFVYNAHPLALVSYSIGITVFGGFAPFANTWLIDASGNKLAPDFYLMFVRGRACSQCYMRCERS
jgi:hypothetical protein